MTKKNLNTAYDFGHAYAVWGHGEKLDGFDRAVDIGIMVHSTQEIPDGDYRAMADAGVEPDAREYWKGYNAFFEEHK